MSYRYDIEGLRAVAVLLVVIFHINEALITGGFVGVDLFFVISGYVITQRIYKDGLNSLADFGEFYRRRIRRITPIMLFVTAITLIVGIFVLLPEDLMDLSWSAIFASFSAANVYFTYFLDTSYFAKDSNYVPLLHLWSLGVEEQFYLIWPLLLFVLLKFPRAIFPVLIAVMVASVAWGEYWIRTGNYSAAYYMLPSRAFQLCAGGFCLFLAQTSFLRNLPARVLLPIGVTGAALVAASAYFLTGLDQFPGLNAVPVTLGAALLLLSGTKTNILSRTLSLKPLVFIGGISYSMYLWHWPILAYLRYLYVDIGLAEGIAIFIALILLSYLSATFVEKPLRYSKDSFKKIFNTMFAIPTAAICAACAVVVGTSGFIPVISPPDYSARLDELRDETKPAYDYPYVCQRYIVKASDTTDMNCIINGSTEPKILLWGDSNAAHYIGILGQLAQNENASFRNIEHGACPPILDDGYRFAAPRVQNACRQSLDAVYPIIPNYDHIIIAALYTNYTRNPEFLPALKQTVKKLTNENKHVTLIGQAISFRKYDRFCRQKALKVNIDCESMFLPVTQNISTVNNELKKLADEFASVKYVDFNDLLCAAGECSPYREGKPLFFDEGHISMVGSWVLGKDAVTSGKYDRLVFR